MYRTTLPRVKSKTLRCTPVVGLITRQQVSVHVLRKHIATETDSCQLLAHTCMVICYRHITETNLQHTAIKLMELDPS